MRTEDSGVDPAVEEERPEREAVRGPERSSAGATEQEAGEVEREAPVEESDRAGVESPPPDADRASLLP